MSEAPDRFETVAWVYSQSDLAIILSLLEHEDIWVLPVGYHHISVQWSWTIALGGVELRVHAEDAVAARALFADAARAPCRRGVFADNRLLDILIVLLLFATSFFAPPARMPPEFAIENRRKAT